MAVKPPPVSLKQSVQLQQLQQNPQMMEAFLQHLSGDMGMDLNQPGVREQVMQAMGMLQGMSS
jgi:hypothetical protein